MIKVLTREYLATYVYLESEIKRIRRRIKYYEEHPLQGAYGIVKGSLQQFPFTECNFMVSGTRPKSSQERERQIRQLMIDLRENEQLFGDMMLDIESFVEALPPEEAEMRTILGLHYIERRSEEEVGEELGYHQSTIHKKISAFLRKQRTLQ